MIAIVSCLTTGWILLCKKNHSDSNNKFSEPPLSRCRIPWLTTYLLHLVEDEKTNGLSIWFSEISNTTTDTEKWANSENAYIENSKGHRNITVNTRKSTIGNKYCLFCRKICTTVFLVKLLRLILEKNNSRACVSFFQVFSNFLEQISVVKNSGLFKTKIIPRQQLYLNSKF